LKNDVNVTSISTNKKKTYNKKICLLLLKVNDENSRSRIRILTKCYASATMLDIKLPFTVVHILGTGTQVTCCPVLATVLYLFIAGKVFNHIQTAPTIHNMLPGTRFQGTVEAYLENGLKVKVFI
jgi:hypothetical protein